MQSFNGKRLKEARYFNSMSITELASELGVTKQTISKYENNKVNNLNSDILFKLGQVLKFPLSFYFNDDKFVASNSETFYRSRFTATQKQKSPTESLKNLAYIYRDFLEEYLDFPLLKLSSDSIHSLDKLYEERNFEQIAQGLRDSWGLGTQPIHNIINLLERNGFIVCDIPKKMEKIDAFGGKETINGNDYYIIFIEDNESDFFRRQFSCAHELGHWALHSEIINPQDLETSEYRSMEQEANDFAAAFLLPQESFSNDLNNRMITLDYLVTLSDKWHVSVAAMLMRAKKLRILSDDAYLRLQKQMSARKWRKFEPHSEKFSVKHPQSLKEGTELLVSSDILRKQDIPYLLEESYGRSYPNWLIENIANLPKGYIDSDKDKQIVTIKGEPYPTTSKNK